MQPTDGLLGWLSLDAAFEADYQTSIFDETLIKVVFNDAKKCAEIIHKPRAGTWVKECVKTLCVKRDDAELPDIPIIPIVMPLTLQLLAQALQWDEIANYVESSKINLSQFILQLAYALEFVDQYPMSPFIINARLFPLKESIAFLVRDESIEAGPGSLHFTLEKLIMKHCPDIIQAKEENYVQLLGIDKPVCNPREVYESICDCINGRDTSLELSVEEIYLRSLMIYPSLNVDVEAVRAIMATGHTQPKYYSYLALCKDPLVLLKARASIWKINDVRYILLRILHSLMSANECLVMQSSVTNDVAEDYLIVRDTIIVRCIVLVCGSSLIFGTCESKLSSSIRSCVRCIDMVRSIVTKRRGIIAALFKQGLPESCIDWLIEFVPESILDGPIIIALLEEKGLLTATEYLTVASSGLQIAAVLSSPHGGQINKDLISASVAVLLESFPLVVGPIGVPVSVLRDENGQDVTYVCRKVMFSMLDTLSSLRDEYTDLRGEALTNISTLCVNENNAVAGIPGGLAATNRKALLKEIWEKCDAALTQSSRLA
jgi:hypothetical protein